MLYGQQRQPSFHEHQQADATSSWVRLSVISQVVQVRRVALQFLGICVLWVGGNSVFGYGNSQDTDLGPLAVPLYCADPPDPSQTTPNLLTGELHNPASHPIL